MLYLHFQPKYVFKREFEILNILFISAHSKALSQNLTNRYVICDVYFIPKLFNLWLILSIYWLNLVACLGVFDMNHVITGAIGNPHVQLCSLTISQTFLWQENAGLGL